jgi:hypothetical protein
MTIVPNSVGIQEVNRERAEMETAFPGCVIIRPEQHLYVRLWVENGDVWRLKRSG